MSEKRELTALEVLNTINEICQSSGDCGLCPFYGVHCFSSCSGGVFLGKRVESVLEVCTKWNEEHRPKPIVVEFAWVCRIYSVDDHHERRLCAEYDVTGYDEEKRAQELLVEYAQEHQDGTYIATVEEICRIKK